MSEITAADVEHLAALARIDLDDNEVEPLREQLVSIQRLITKVQEVATPDVPRTSHPIALRNVFRADEPGETLRREDALAGAPDHDETRFRVASILGAEQ